MISQDKIEATIETSRLLSELDSAIDQSSVLRVIIGKYEYLRCIENMTGPSRITRMLRREIQALENRLREVRKNHRNRDESVYSPV